jgi:adenine deaminase
MCSTWNKKYYLFLFIMKAQGNLVDIHARMIYPVEILIKNGRIDSVKSTTEVCRNFIIPGLIDAHIHIESSMLSPGSFAVASVPHGTIGVVADPHEIGNVLGTDGVMAMIEAGKKVPLRFFFGAPSCVPATRFETSGAGIDALETEKLLANKDILFLAEMMNYPGVINQDKEVMQKIRTAARLNKKIDGHAPGLSGEMLWKYVEAGISTDHECSTIEEALEKISLGMKILIREGSAARNLDALKDLYRSNPDKVMLCSDDLHPEMLRERHINKLVSKLISEGYNLFDVIRSATYNPVMHYGLDAGLLRPGDNADFIIVDDPEKMNVIETWIGGNKVFDRGKVMFGYKTGLPINKFNCTPLNFKDIYVARQQGKMRVIQAFDGELLTRELIVDISSGTAHIMKSEEDILKIVVKDRYNDSPPAVAFINGFGLKTGAIAGSVAHDSHNIICVGTSDDEIIRAINEVIRLKGGLVVCSGSAIKSLQLEIAGIMTGESCEKVASKYQKLSDLARSLGTKLTAPFMTLSFMALLVIPDLKLSDKGLFDGKKFCHVPLFVD